MDNNKTRAAVDFDSLKRLQETKESLKQVESFPYRENLRSVMEPDVLTCRPDDTLKSIFKQMADHHVSSIIVVDHEAHPVGILTERDIMQRVVTVDDS